MKKTVFILILFGIFAVKLHAEELGAIFSKSYPNSLSINMGPCYIGDSLLSDFVLENYSNKLFKLNSISPSFAIKRSPLEVITDEFRSFRAFQTSFPIIIQPKANNDLFIQYKAETNIVIFPLGWYNSVLEIGFLDDLDTGVVLQKVFELKAKKTNKFIDGYEDVIRFDSIYVNPPIAVEQNWRVKSTFKDSLSVFQQKYSLISQQLTDDEFYPALYPINPIFREKYDEISWKIGYKPLDAGNDTSQLVLSYKPFPIQYPDSLQFTKVTAIGTGVNQDLRLIGSNYKISNDTIYVGEIKANQEFSVTGKILNNGNLPFGTLSEEIIPGDIELISKFTEKFANKYHLSPQDTSSFAFNINLKHYGYFALEYRIESDISNRKIHYPPSGTKYKKIYVVGNAIEPIIQTYNDTVDFGSLYLYLPYCESYKDTTLLLLNPGNDTLRISKIEIINQVPNFSFTTEISEIKISPNGRKSIEIKFEPTLAMNYSADLVIHSNAVKSKYIIKLKGISTTPAITSVRIDSIYGKPGSIVEVPIKADSNVVYANEFSDTLYYNRSLLHYVGYSIENTATNLPIRDIFIEEFEDGKLFVHILKQTKSRFARKPNLINLKFKAFLGNARSTEISFTKPHFSNEICDFALNMPKSNITNGTFIIDSICGIDLKTYPQVITVNSVYPNPNVGHINVDFVLNENAELKFEVFDAFGNIIFRSGFEKYFVGFETKGFQIPIYQTGIFYLRISDKFNLLFNSKLIMVK